MFSELRARGTRLEIIELDLAHPASPARLMDYTYQKLGQLDILVNNACHSEQGGADDLDAEPLDRHYAVNLRATALLCVEFARRRPPNRPGRIVNITSGQGHDPMPGELAYAATKGGVDALTLSLSAGLASRGITVNAVGILGPRTQAGCLPT